jgi:purine-binding chemotaxis protein CheW
MSRSKNGTSEPDPPRLAGSAGNAITVLLFSVAGMRCALELECVSSVLRAAALTPLPGAPRGVRGLLNLYGVLLPVFDPARGLDLAERELRVTDRYVVARTARRAVALLVESVEGLGRCPVEALAEAKTLHPQLQGIKGAAVLEDGVVVIYDLEGFFSLSEEQELEAALAGKGAER